ncbi:MAG: hypothetical protein AB1465_05425 [Patescibacteria group bacterium]
MELNRKSRWVKAFFWSLGIIDKFTNHEYYSQRQKYESGTDLCHLIRVIFVYMPLVFLLHLSLFAAGVLFCLVLPIIWFGIKGYFIILGVVAGLIVSVILFGGVLVLFNKIIEKIKGSTRTEKSESVEEDSKNLSVIKLWLQAKKDKICPIVVFRNSSEAAQ